MPTPIGHSLAGLALGQTRRDAGSRIPWRWYAFAVVVANAADFDFIPGLLTGDINRFHHQFTHSITMAVIVGLLTTLVLWGRKDKAVSLGVTTGALYASHLLLDLFGADARAPHGIPLLWPFSAEYFIAPVTPFMGVLHANPGDPFSAFLSQLLSWHNLGVALVEALLLVPFVLIAWYLSTTATRKEKKGTLAQT